MKNKKKWHHLRHEERQVLHVMRERGESLREIGKVLGRPAGTLCKELKRNKVTELRVRVAMTPIEKARAAHTKAKDRAVKSRRREKFRGGLRDVVVQQWIVDRLSVDKWSPEIIAATVNKVFPDVRFSASTLYRFIKLFRKDLIPLLPHRGKKYRQQVCSRRGIYRGGCSIEQRPAIAGVFGHHEIDTVVSSKHPTSVLTGRELVSKYVMLRKVDNLKALTIKHKLHGYIHALPEIARQSWTHDNGSEFADVFELEQSLAIETYRCHPYSAWERGSVENLNGLLRRFFPKGTDFRDVSEEQLASVEHSINNRPMKCLQWKTPIEVFEQLSNQQ